VQELPTEVPQSPAQPRKQRRMLKQHWAHKPFTKGDSRNRPGETHYKQQHLF